MTFLYLIQLLFVPVFSPLVVGVIRKTKAKYQKRQGASIFQPYRDIWKLFHKDEIITRDASWVTFVAPFIVFSVTLIVGASVPLFGAFFENGATSDLLFIVYTLAIGTFFLALAGMDSGGGFGGFGASREMTVSALAEGGFIFSLFTLVFLTGRMNGFEVAGIGTLLDGQFILPLILAFVAFFIVLLAETARFPFDNPATHLELTMIHEALLLEYSGKRLALMEWAAANKLLIFIALGANLFFPWGIAVTGTPSAVVMGMVAFALKVLLFAFAIATLESTIAKFRYFRLPDLLFTSFILNCVAIGLIF